MRMTTASQNSRLLLAYLALWLCMPVRRDTTGSSRTEILGTTNREFIALGVVGAVGVLWLFTGDSLFTWLVWFPTEPACMAVDALTDASPRTFRGGEGVPLGIEWRGAYVDWVAGFQA